jgi:hypothetical protein
LSLRLCPPYGFLPLNPSDGQRYTFSPSLLTGGVVASRCWKTRRMRGRIRALKCINRVPCRFLLNHQKAIACTIRWSYCSCPWCVRGSGSFLDSLLCCVHLLSVVTLPVACVIVSCHFASVDSFVAECRNVTQSDQPRGRVDGHTGYQGWDLLSRLFSFLVHRGMS